MGEAEDSDQGVADTSIASAAREVEEFVASAGWDQAPQLFALVTTEELLARQPDLAGHLDPDAALTPIAQDALPETDLAEALARIAWPDAVRGCALAQEIIVLPPDAEADLAEQVDATAAPDAERLRKAAANHPRRTEARLVAAVSRDGARACVLRLRGSADQETSADQESADQETSEALEPDEVIEHPGLAPNLLDALQSTFAP
ncbi:MAG: PPA1309 family protein [Haloechinothrix sp.]